MWQIDLDHGKTMQEGAELHLQRPSPVAIIELQTGKRLHANGAKGRQIAKAAAEEQANQGEYKPISPARMTVAVAGSAIGKGAHPQRQICAMQKRLHQGGNAGRIGRVVGVEKDDRARPRLQRGEVPDPGQAGGAVAAHGLVHNSRSGGAGQGGRAIGRAVVNHHNRKEGGGQRGQGGRKGLFFIQSRDENGGTRQEGGRAGVDLPSVGGRPTGRILLSGLLLTLLLALFGWLPSLALPLPRLLLPATAFLCYLHAGLAAERFHRIAAPHVTIIVWAIAIGTRLALLPLPPFLSDDIYRYLWDGHLLVQGVNPYAHPPDADALAGLRTPWHDRINHPDVPTIYPPATQLLFGAVAGAGGLVMVAKSLWLLFDLGCGLLLGRIARRRGRPPLPTLIWYLWSPLLIVETAWSAHFDAVGLFLLAALILTVDPGPLRNRVHGPKSLMHNTGQGSVRLGASLHAIRSGGLLALATLVKFAPAIVLPLLYRRQGAWTLVGFGGVAAALTLPFAGPGILEGWVDLTAGLRIYARHWSANEGAFALLEALVGDPVAARLAAAGTVGGVAILVAWRRFPMERALLWTIGAGILLSPTIHPWYTLWTLPMAALCGSRAFLVLGGLAFLGYWGLGTYLESGIWPQPALIRWILWAPVWALLIAAARRAGSGRNPP